MNYVNNTSSCTNPPNLDETAFIDTTASVTLLTTKNTTATTTNANVQISVIQPSWSYMTTTHAVNLLLRKLPPGARLRHRLPGLVNNLVLVAVLVNMECKVFFHSQDVK